jgi:hypothetical protein
MYKVLYQGATQADDSWVTADAVAPRHIANYANRLERARARAGSGARAPVRAPARAPAPKRRTVAGQEDVVAEGATAAAAGGATAAAAGGATAAAASAAAAAASRGGWGGAREGRGPPPPAAAAAVATEVYAVQAKLIEMGFDTEPVKSDRDLSRLCPCHLSPVLVPVCARVWPVRGVAGPRRGSARCRARWATI